MRAPRPAEVTVPIYSNYLYKLFPFSCAHLGLQAKRLSIDAIGWLKPRFYKHKEEALGYVNDEKILVRGRPPYNRFVIGY